MSASILILFCFALLILFIIPYTREEMKKMTGLSFQLIAQYVVAYCKILLKDHYLIFKNFWPRNIVFPTLENKDQVNQNV